MTRLFASKVRTLLALGTLTALVTVATLRPLPSVLGQDKETPTRKVEQKGEEKAEEKTENKAEPAPAKEAEPKKEGRGEKTEKEPMKGEEKAPEKTEKAPAKEEGRVPRKVEGKEPMKEEGDAPRKVEGKNPEGRPVPRKGDPEVSKDPVPGRVRPVPGKEMKEPGEGKRPVPGKEVPKVTPKEVEQVVIESLPEDFDDQQRLAYRRLEHQDLPFEEYLRFAKLEFGRLRQLKMNPALRYQPGRRGKSATHTACGNGDFEPPMTPSNAVNPAEWDGGYGTVLPTGVVDYPNFATGLLPGAISSFSAHQTIVSAGTDPNVPIQMTGPNTFASSPISPNAVRIGNAMPHWGAELLAKTFVVTPSQASMPLPFWYAVVLENPLPTQLTPLHTPDEQPAFQVRVLDNSTTPPTEVVGVVDLGNGTSKLVADTTNTFFQTKTRPAPAAPIVYRDWSCAQINLSTLVGKSVTIEFVTQDCAQGGHWGYAYVDDFCGTCKDSPTGDIAFDPDTSTQCGKGQVCFKYTLPTTHYPSGIVTGTAVITLGIFQTDNNGTPHLLQTLTSPTLSTDGTHCFPIDPATIPGLNPALGFDLVATGVFTLGGNNLPLFVGTVPNGIILGNNNDYNNPRICNGTPGTIVHDGKASTVCGKGQICFNLRLPTMTDPNGNVITATGQIHLTLYKGGGAVVSLPASPVLSAQTGTSYCFPIDPASIPGLNPGGFDFVATANFTFGTSGTPPQTATVGTVPNGIIPGPNNDYNDPRICPEDPKPKECGCCPGKELVVNGDFEQGTEIHSEYEWTSEYNTLFPGTYSVGHVDKIEKFCSNWKLPKECKGTKDFYENVLIVNGQTNQPAGSTTVIWEQQIVLPSGGKEADYRLCFRYLPLPQCCFDIQAKPYVLVNGGRIPLTDDCDEDKGCGHLYAATFHGAGTVNVQIVLPEDRKGDGNDCLIDNISMVKIEPVPANQLTFSPDAGDVVNGMFDVTSVAPAALVSSSCTWDWELYRGHAPNVMDPALFTLVQGSTQANQPTSTFTGLPQIDGNGPIMYWVKLTVDCGCSKGAVYRPAAQFNTLRSLKLEGKSIEDPNPQRVKRVKAAPAPAPVKRSE